jgi:hypothetical protein
MPTKRNASPRWAIEYTPEVARWLRSLTEKDATRIGTAIRQLELEGPTLGGGIAKLIKGSRHHNMKELCSVGGYIRVLFAFDRRQHAILLVGGDKAGNWDGWYKRHVPVADKRYENHLRSSGKEGSWRATAQQAGGRSAAAGR